MEEIRLSDHFTYSRLLRFTLPSIAMMIFTSIYGVVDGFFVSNFAGKTAFAAVNLLFPLLMILATVGFMFGTGGTALVAKAFGEKDAKRANRYFSLFVYFSFAIATVLAMIGFILMRPISTLLGAGSEGELLESCIIYGRIVIAALPFFTLQLLFQSFFVTAEKPKLGLAVTVSSGLTNMILDAVLVLLLPEEYKLVGAAIATAASQAVGGVIPLFYFFRKNDSILRLGKTHFDGKALIKASVNGSSEFMSNVSMNLVGMLYNLQLMAYAGEDGISAYGVMMYVSMIFSAAFIGYSIGTAPLVGYHNGAKHHDELHSLLNKSLKLTGVCGICMLIVSEWLALPLSKIFVSYDPALLDLTVSGFRIFAISFPLMSFAILGSGFFTALGDGVTSAIISFLRTLVFQIAAVLLLPLIFDINGIWMSIIVAEFMAVALSVLFLIVKQKKYHY